MKSTKTIKDKRLKDRSKKVIASVMKSHTDRSRFEKELEKNNISVLFRTNDEGRIYGTTFIDHEQKVVFNGSRLGKDFSANVFNDLFNGIHHEQVLKQDSGQSFEPFDYSRKEDDSGIGSVFSLLSPEVHGANPEEEIFARKAKKKKKKQKRL